MRIVMSNRISGLLAAVLFLCAGSAVADQITTAPANIKTLAANSDSVIIGKCTGKSTAMVGRNIETTYEVQVSQSLKGQRRVGSSMKLVTPGGKHPVFALAQHVPQQAHLFKGEEVALFLKEPQPGAKKNSLLPEKSGLADTAKVLGGWQGKYSVFADSADKGKKKLVRFNLENYGYANNDKALSQFIGSYASGDIEKKTADGVKKQMATITEAQKQSGEDKSVVLSAPSVNDILPPVVTMEDFRAEVESADKK